MKKILKSWITWVIVAVACFATAYFINANQETRVENVEKIEVVEEPTIETDSVEVVEIAIEEAGNEETNVELNTVETNE